MTAFSCHDVEGKAGEREGKGSGLKGRAWE